MRRQYTTPSHGHDLVTRHHRPRRSSPSRNNVSLLRRASGGTPAGERGGLRATSWTSRSAFRERYLAPAASASRRVRPRISPACRGVSWSSLSEKTSGPMLRGGQAPRIACCGGGWAWPGGERRWSVSSTGSSPSGVCDPSVIWTLSGSSAAVRARSMRSGTPPARCP